MSKKEIVKVAENERRSLMGDVSLIRSAMNGEIPPFYEIAEAVDRLGDCPEDVASEILRQARLLNE